MIQKCPTVFTILITKPAKKFLHESDYKLSSWLPVGTESFHLYMRIYLPEDSAINGTWKAPAIIKSSAQ